MILFLQVELPLDSENESTSDDKWRYEIIDGDTSADNEDSGIKRDDDDDKTEAKLIDLVSSRQHSDPNVS